MANYLVTGGAGFIGSHLVDRLVELGHAVRVLDDFSSGSRENLAPVAERIDLMEGDLRRIEDCRRACAEVEIVLHQGAVPSVPASVKDPTTSHTANVDGTYNVLLAARDAGCRRVVYAASSAAYGETETLPKREDQTPAPLSPYAVQKLAGEYYCRAFTACYDLDTVSLRYFNVFGPRQNPKSQYAAAIPAFVTAILGDTPPTVFDDGEQTRDFTYIENVIHANLLAAEAKRTGGEAINIACGERISINRIIACINEIAGKNVRPEHAPPRPGDIRHSLADITRAGELIGYSPQVSFDDGLRRAVDWYAEHWPAPGGASA